MGKVRTESIKRVARDLLRRYPERFGKDFEENKKSLEGLIVYDAKKTRNRVAGYITRLKRVEEARTKVLESAEEGALEKEA
ncbi:MAG: 30S ribosomal protein S17e [Candidatus Bathyarchaeia archaeon]